LPGEAFGVGADGPEWTWQKPWPFRSLLALRNQA